MRSERAVREHEKGVVLAIAVLVVTVVVALVIALLLMVGCALGAAGSDGSGASPADDPQAGGGGATGGELGASAAAVAAPTTSTTTTIPPFVPGTALCIGDSVMLGASPQFHDTLAMCGTVDASVSRAWASAPSAVEGRDLPDRVVVHLGTNGSTDAAEIDAVLAHLAEVPRVVLVNVQTNGSRRWEAPVNAEIAAALARWPNVRLADWYGASAGRPELFRGDAIHPSRAGAVAYAGVIAAQL